MWRIATSILETWQMMPPPVFPNYPAGSWGPSIADDLIERDGWEQGYSATERSCAYIAVDRVARIHGHYGDAIRALREQIGVPSISNWNDRLGRTKAEVVAALRAAVERAA